MNFQDTEAQEQIKLMSGALHDSPIGYIAINESLEICMANKKLSEESGYSSVELYGEHVNLLLAELHHERHIGHLKEWFSHPVPLDLNRRGQLFLRTYGGVQKPVKIQVYPKELYDPKTGMFQVGKVVKPTLFGIASIIFE